MTSTPPRLQPALLGGALIGVLSALPVVGWLNTCCCLWVVIGGAVALWISQSNHPYPVTAADGALVGLLAGLIGGLVAIPLNLVFAPIQRQLLMRLIDASQAEIPPQVRTMMENAGQSSIGIVVNGVLMTALYAIFAMLGGLLGVALFRKKDAPPPPGTVEILPPDGGTSF
jgi:hypothetical protein